MGCTVCRLTPREAQLYERERVLPDCRNCNPMSENVGNHKHDNIEEARTKAGADDGTGRTGRAWIGRLNSGLEKP